MRPRLARRNCRRMANEAKTSTEECMIECRRMANEERCGEWMDCSQKD